MRYALSRKAESGQGRPMKWFIYRCSTIYDYKDDCGRLPNGKQVRWATAALCVL
jgi:hypothetical protein